MFDNHSKPSGNYIQRLIQTFTLTFCHTAYVVSFLLRTANISPNSINQLVFRMETQCIYCDVRTEHLYIIYRNLKPVFRLPGLLRTSLRIPPVDRRAVRSF